MRLRSFIIAYALAPALLLFAVRRPAPRQENRYSQVVDLTVSTRVKTGSEARSGTRIISPAALVPGTWGAAQIPAERLIGPLVVMDLNASSAQFLSMTSPTGNHSMAMCHLERLLRCDVLDLPPAPRQIDSLCQPMLRSF